MATKRHRRMSMGASELERQLEVRREIDTFLRAVNSYPEHFAREPYVSFEQHLFSITAKSGNDRDRNR
jgi:hypothetical protein